MKKFYCLFLSAQLLVFLFSCEKVDELLTFEIDNSSDISIPATPLIGNSPITIETPEISSSSTSAFEENNVSEDRVKDIKLTDMTLIINAPEDETFSFLKDIELYISGEDLPEILLASKIDIEDDVTGELKLDVSESNVDDYVKGDSYEIRTVVTIDETIPEDVDITADMTFSVTANVL